MKTKALLFDWDGVVIDSASLHCRSWELLSQELDKPLPNNHFEAGFGKRNETIIPEILDWTNDATQINHWGKRKEQLYRQLGKKEGITLLPGVKEFLEQAYRQSFLLCVGTSTEKKNVLLAMKQHGLDKFFHGIIASEDVTHGKPNPEVFLKGARKLGCNPDECVVFEDSPHGILAAKKAKMKTIALSTTHPEKDLRELTPDLILASFVNQSIDIIHSLDT
jgi:HAD superfamily hydrolase (TIGR01509 family)